MRTLRALFAAVLALPAVALAQDIGMYNRALSSFNGGDYDAAAAQFYEITNSSTDPEVRTKSEYYLAQSLQKRGLPFTAFVEYAAIVKAGKAHPYYLKAVEGVVNVQQQMGEQYLIPALLDRNYNEDWATLPAEVLNRINYLVGISTQRKSKFDEAKGFFEGIPSTSPLYAKAQYRLGIVLADPRFPGGAKPDAAIAAFEQVRKQTGGEDVENVKYLATLGLGRVYYGIGQYQKSVDAYEQIPRFSKYWDQALFENGFARFQNDDYGGALGSLQALHAPQFAGAFQPESWILKATVYYFSCLYEESKTALAAFDEVYQPMNDQLKPLIEGEHDLDTYFKLINDRENSKLPKPVFNWVRGNERMIGVFETLSEIEKEKDLLANNKAWQGSKMGPELTTSLDANRGVLGQVAGTLAKTQLKTAVQQIKTFSDQAEIIRFETSKAEKELAEAGVDQRKVLAKQTLYRPQMPAENWNYWKFQGEFWIDEIGYYQYTLKKGCAAGANE